MTFDIYAVRPSSGSIKRLLSSVSEQEAKRMLIDYLPRDSSEIVLLAWPSDSTPPERVKLQSPKAIIV